LLTGSCVSEKANAPSTEDSMGIASQPFNGNDTIS
jgi:hypothetical protein